MHALQSLGILIRHPRLVIGTHDNSKVPKLSQPSGNVMVLLTQHCFAGCSNHRAGDYHVSLEGMGGQLQPGSTPSSGSQQLGQMEDSHAGNTSPPAFLFCCVARRLGMAVLDQAACMQSCCLERQQHLCNPLS